MMSQMEPTLGVARSAWKFFLPLAAVTLLLALAGFAILAVITGILAAYILYFFRDPNRKTPGIPNSISCPADGKVVSVLEVPCEDMPGGKARRVAIFLNVFNVHVQRSPVAGRVYRVDNRPGKLINALNEKCSDENEAVTMWIDSTFGPIGVRQIAGAIARRIVCAAENGTQLERGQRYGIIQFGSRVELFLPLSASVKVQAGQKVTGGLTCLAVIHEEVVRKGLTPERVERLAEQVRAAG